MTILTLGKIVFDYFSAGTNAAKVKTNLYLKYTIESSYEAILKTLSSHRQILARWREDMQDDFMLEGWVQVRSETFT